MLATNWVRYPRNCFVRVFAIFKLIHTLYTKGLHEKKRNALEHLIAIYWKES